jgi:hypothetical protein
MPTALSLIVNEDSYMSKESKITAQEKQFRTLAELTWTKNTIYARDKEQFHTFKPQGQCGITNFGLGVWLVWRGLANPQHLLYAEGQVHAANGELIDDKHAWLLRSKAFSKQLRHADLALDQYAGVGQRVVAGLADVSKSAASISDYRLEVEDDTWPCRTTNVTYSPDTITPIADYDTEKFNGRLDMFLGSCYNSTFFMGQQAVKGAVADLWLPTDSSQPTENRLATLSNKPCDAQLFSSI